MCERAAGALAKHGAFAALCRSVTVCAVRLVTIPVTATVSQWSTLVQSVDVCYTRPPARPARLRIGQDCITSRLLKCPGDAPIFAYTYTVTYTYL